MAFCYSIANIMLISIDIAKSFDLSNSEATLCKSKNAHFNISHTHF